MAVIVKLSVKYVSFVDGPPWVPRVPREDGAWVRMYVHDTSDIRRHWISHSGPFRGPYWYSHSIDVADLLRAGVPVDARNAGYFGTTPAHWVRTLRDAEAACAALMALPYSKRAEVLMSTEPVLGPRKTSELALHCMLRHRCAPAALRMMLSVLNDEDRVTCVNACEMEGRTALHMYPHHYLQGGAEIISILVDAGADVNAVDNVPEKALEPVAHTTASLVRDIKLKLRPIINIRSSVWLWVERGERPASRTPLHYAAQECRPSVVRALLQAGASPEARDAEGLTPEEFGAKYRTNEDFGDIEVPCKVVRNLDDDSWSEVSGLLQASARRGPC